MTFRDFLFSMIAALLVFHLAPVSAETKIPKLRPSGIKGNDDRIRVDIAQFPWKTIGRLNKDGNFCTGVLIGRDRIITAAHCFWNKRTGRWSKARYFHFVTGYEKGKYTAAAKGVSFVTAFPVLPNLNKVPLRREDDWAILKLDKPLGEKFGYIKISEKAGAQFLKQAKGSGEFLQAGYSRDYAHVLTVHKNCNMTSFSLLRGSKEPVYIHQCDATQGDSGSPIFYKDKGKYSLAAIHSATGQSSDGTVIGIAVPSRQFAKTATKR